MKRIAKYTILAGILTACSYGSSLGQTMAMGHTTPVANTAKNGNVYVSYMIGHIGSGIIRTSTSANGNQAQGGDIVPVRLDISAYPNPFSEYITVKFNYSPNAPRPQIQIIDCTGRLVNARSEFHTDNNNAEFRIPGQVLPQGKYIFRIITGNTTSAVSAVKL